VDGVGTALLISVSFLVKALWLMRLIRMIPGWKFSLRGNRAAASLS
jgi:hypothetical protein